MTAMLQVHMDIALNIYNFTEMITRSVMQHLIFLYRFFPSSLSLSVIQGYVPVVTGWHQLMQGRMVQTIYNFHDYGFTELRP